jgi:hypothetical protein
MISWDGLSPARGQTKPHGAGGVPRAAADSRFTSSVGACAALRVRPLARLAASRADALRETSRSKPFHSRRRGACLMAPTAELGLDVIEIRENYLRRLPRWDPRLGRRPDSVLNTSARVRAIGLSRARRQVASRSRQSPVTRQRIARRSVTAGRGLPPPRGRSTGRASGQRSPAPLVSSGSCEHTFGGGRRPAGANTER